MLLAVSGVAISATDFAASWLSDKVPIKDAQRFYVQISYTGGSPTGTVTLEYSGDGASWVTSSSDNLAGGSPIVFDVLGGTAAAFLRVRWTRTGGAMNGTTALVHGVLP